MMTGMVIEVLLALSQLLDPADDGTLRDDLKLAVERPAAYMEKHPGMRERSTDAANASLPWLALVDGLIARGYAVELDHRDGGDETIHSLGKLKGHALFSAKTRDWMKRVGTKDMSTVDCLRKVAAHAEHDGLVIAVMDIDSDSYVTLILGKDDYARATELAARLGYILKDIREHDPNA